MKGRVIQTEYRGRFFRSRLEARWAVFFDTLEVAWVYEREAYALGDGLAYLPDFWLPELDCWVEIKGEDATQEAHEKARALATATRKRVYIFSGSIELPQGDMPPAMACVYWPDNTTVPARPSMWAHKWCVCPECDAIGIAPGGDGTELPAYGVCDCLFAMGDHVDTSAAPVIIKAYRAALRARFDRSHASQVKRGDA